MHVIHKYKYTDCCRHKVGSLLQNVYVQFNSIQFRPPKGTATRRNLLNSNVAATFMATHSGDPARNHPEGEAVPRRVNQTKREEFTFTTPNMALRGPSARRDANLHQLSIPLKLELFRNDIKIMLLGSKNRGVRGFDGRDFMEVISTVGAGVISHRTGASREDNITV